MNRFLFFFFLSVMSLAVFAQKKTTIIQFTQADTQNYRLDTSDTDDLWQVGTLSNKNFGEARSMPFCIVTDTINSYAVSKSSSFTVTAASEPRSVIFTRYLFVEFYYKLDVGSMGDKGTVNFSADGGKTWTAIGGFGSYIETGPEVFDTDMPAWSKVRYDFSFLTMTDITDTVLVKFTFISDSLAESGAGWAIDDISIIDSFAVSTGIAENFTQPAVFYDMTSRTFVVEGTGEHDVCRLDIVSVSGTVVSCGLEGHRFPLPELAPGCYIAVFTFNNYRIQKKLITF